MDTNPPSQEPDWTSHEGGRVPNTSLKFEQLSKVIEDIIRRSGTELLDGKVDQVARNILGQLAHRFGMAPADEPSSASSPPVSSAMHGSLDLFRELEDSVRVGWRTTVCPTPAEGNAVELPITVGRVWGEPHIWGSDGQRKEYAASGATLGDALIRLIADQKGEVPYAG